MRDHLVIFINGQRIEVRGDEAFLTLSEFLRRRQRLTGTKVVCAEGDCGSCSVLVGRVSGDVIDYAPVTSCIQLMFQLDGYHVITVEGLSVPGAGATQASPQLNPIQQAMVTCHGAQCGFCTPGFVVSMYSLLEGSDACDANQIRRGLVGNLCRCTGYESIVRAAMTTDRATLKPIDALYPPAPMLAALSRATAEDVLVESGAKKFYKPATLEQATRFRSENPACTIVAGATDIGVQCNKRVRELGVVMSMGGMAALRSIEVKDGAIHVGATATLSELERVALEHLPELGTFLAWFGSPLIKNAGTLAGNLVNGSPIADTTPAMMALDADVELASARGSRSVKVNAFYTGYRKTVLASDEIVTRLRIPIPHAGETFKLYKISRRKDLDIATFGAAIWMRKAGDRIDDIRIAYGGVAATVLRMKKVEDFLRGGAATRDRFEQAGEIAKGELTPISDVRGSAAYRAVLARNILMKFWHDLRQDGSNGEREPNSPSLDVASTYHGLPAHASD